MQIIALKQKAHKAVALLNWAEAVKPKENQEWNKKKNNSKRFLLNSTLRNRDKHVNQSQIYSREMIAQEEWEKQS